MALPTIRDFRGVSPKLDGQGNYNLGIADFTIFPEITVEVLEQAAEPLVLGKADGVSCRSMEMYEAFGISEYILKEAYWVNETTFWRPDDARREHIVRSGRPQDVEDGLSEFPHVILNQARVHDFLLEAMRRGPARLEPYYSRRLLELTVDAASAGLASATSTGVAGARALDAGVAGFGVEGTGTEQALARPSRRTARPVRPRITLPSCADVAVKAARTRRRSATGSRRRSAASPRPSSIQPPSLHRPSACR